MAAAGKYSHLSNPDPEFSPFQAAINERFDSLWENALREGKPNKEFLDAWLQPLDLPEGTPTEEDLDISHRKITVTDGTQVDLRVYKSKDVKKQATLFFVCHGGGWVVASHNMEEGMNRWVAAMCAAVVVSVDYRMAPDYPFPTPLNDCWDSLNYVRTHAAEFGVNPEKVVIGGGSAGGNLTAALALRARDENLKGLIGQVLNIPVTCHPQHFPLAKHELRSYQQNCSAPIVDQPKMDWFWNLYLPNKEPNPYASPLLAETFKGLPPALVQIAGLDPLRDEGLAYAEELKSAGIPVTLEVYPGLPHGFYFLTHLKAATKYLSNVVDFINRISA